MALILGGLFIGMKSRGLTGAEAVTTERFMGEGELQSQDGVLIQRFLEGRADFSMLVEGRDLYGSDGIDEQE